MRAVDKEVRKIEKTSSELRRRLYYIWLEVHLSYLLKYKLNKQPLKISEIS